MKIGEAVLENHIAPYVIILFFLVFGSVALLKLPVQLTPEVEEPEISIVTYWRASSPEEVENEIVEPQEDALKGLPGVTRIVSQAQRGRASVALSFAVGFDLNRALIEVINRLNRITDLPADADQPRLNTIGGRSRAVAWFIIKTTEENPNDISQYMRFVEETVQSRFERVNGVAASQVHGGNRHELRITVDPYRSAALGVNIPQAAARLRNQSDVSGGGKDIGKRSYIIRFEGAYELDSFRNLVLEWRDQHAIYLRDIADIQLQLQEDDSSFVISNNELAIAVNASREAGVNIMEVMRQLSIAKDELRAGPLAQAGLSIEQVYDETIYIHSAIRLLFGNLLIGVFLAALVLWLFTRQLRATLIVSMSIPISLFAALIVILLTGHTLNVISLASLALAAGMVLDASIITVESILKLREQGQPILAAIVSGIARVRGALIASTATTVAVFLPILLLEEEAGQLFADLAIGLSTAITVSLFAALVIVPALSHQWIADKVTTDRFTNLWDKATDIIMRSTATKSKRRALIASLFIVPISFIFLLLPKADYLPAGNRELVFAYILPPPGMNVETLKKEMGQAIMDKLAPHLQGLQSPAIRHYFFVGFPRGSFMGARAQNAEDTDQLVPLINNMLREFPATIGFAKRTSLFSYGDPRTVEIDLQSRNMDALLSAAQGGYNLLMQALPGAQIRPQPGLELSDPQLRLLPIEERISEAGWSRNEVGLIARFLGQGVYIDDYFDGYEKIDIIARTKEWQTVEQLAAIPLTTPAAGTLPLSELVHIERHAGPNQIRRVDRRRTVTLEVRIPPQISLEEAIDIVENQVKPDLYELLPADGFVSYSGSANKLAQIMSDMGGTFALAVIILYLLMAMLFRSFRDSLLIVVSLPLATIGGIIMLRLINLFGFQPMDLLTMIGFIILLGLVANNAILLVDQTRQEERAGRSRQAATRTAVRTRLRPIAMSTLTSLLGMLPLLVAPVAGSELYRGMAAVIVGGLAVSTIFVLLLLPALLQSGAATVNKN